MKFQEWQLTVPETITNDSLWKMQVYRIALFAAEIGWQDITQLSQDRRMLSLADQLYRALGSISANIAEGYSRSTGKDRARFFEYALGSARESRDWYYKARVILGDQVVNERLELLTHIVRQLIMIIPSERRDGIREETALYDLSNETLND